MSRPLRSPWRPDGWPAYSSAGETPVRVTVGDVVGAVVVVTAVVVALCVLSGCASYSGKIRVVSEAPAPEGGKPAASCSLEGEFSAWTSFKNVTLAGSDPSGLSFAYGSQVDASASQAMGLLGAALRVIGAANGVPLPAAAQGTTPDLAGCVPVTARSPAAAAPGVPKAPPRPGPALAPGRHAGRDGRVRYLDAAWGDTVWFRHADGSRHVLPVAEWLARVGPS